MIYLKQLELSSSSSSSSPASQSQVAKCDAGRESPLCCARLIFNVSLIPSAQERRKESTFQQRFPIDHLEARALASKWKACGAKWNHKRLPQLKQKLNRSSCLLTYQTDSQFQDFACVGIFELWFIPIPLLPKPSRVLFATAQLSVNCFLRRNEWSVSCQISLLLPHSQLAVNNKWAINRSIDLQQSCSLTLILLVMLPLWLEQSIPTNRSLARTHINKSRSIGFLKTPSLEISPPLMMRGESTSQQNK